MPVIPAELKAYLSSNDVLYREQLGHDYPHLKQLLVDPQTRVLILDWLASDEAWDHNATNLTMRCLEFLQNGAVEKEAPVVKTFLLHPNPFIRSRAYEFLLTLYFPDKNREAMSLLFQGMLFDTDDTVRAAAAAYIKRADGSRGMREFLERWVKVASARGWENTDSWELVNRLLSESE